MVVARIAVQGHDAGVRAAGVDDDVVAVDQRRLGESVLRVHQAALEIGVAVLDPAQFAVKADAVVVAHVGLAEERRRRRWRRGPSPPPQALPILQDQILFRGSQVVALQIGHLVVVADDVEAALEVDDRRQTSAQAVDFPGQRRAALGPLVQEVLLGGDAVAQRPAPLRPVAGIHLAARPPRGGRGGWRLRHGRRGQGQNCRQNETESANHGMLLGGLLGSDAIQVFLAADESPLRRTRRGSHRRSPRANRARRRASRLAACRRTRRPR